MIYLASAGVVVAIVAFWLWICAGGGETIESWVRRLFKLDK